MSHMPGLLVLVVYALAVARISRFVTRDKLAERPRDAIEAWAYRRAYPFARTSQASLNLVIQTNPTPLIAYLISCSWCASIYIGLTAAIAVQLAGSSPWLYVPALGLAFSHVAGFLASKEG